MKKILPLLILAVLSHYLPAQTALSFYAGPNQIQIVSKYGDNYPYAETKLDAPAGYGAVFILQPEADEVLKPGLEVGYTSNTGRLHVYSGGKGSSSSWSGDFHFRYLLLGFHPELTARAGRLELGLGLGFRLRLLLANERVEVRGLNSDLINGSENIEESGRAGDYLNDNITGWMVFLSARWRINGNWAAGLRATYDRGSEPGKGGFATGNTFRDAFLGGGITYRFNKK
ncbi:MAG: hypothetical protein KDD10_14560 [Phaeodactylibacter sp.]|nr:hypothetical protein [Phaeodactylibacter sp.]MCB9296205.1 hypothetical protein [Lewinellaceae bacterium]